MRKIITLSLVTLTALPAFSVTVVNKTISEEEVLNAQKSWCSALVNISETNRKEGVEKAKKLAESVIDEAYAYDMGAVLFKPTLTMNPQTFRTTKDGALSYFVGGNSKYPKDKGFALKDWTKCIPENSAILISGDTATTMGKVHFINKDGKETTVDKTWQFLKDDKGKLRIVLHHSSLEYTE
ncbi:hypothetical protein CEP49_08000 [Mergibacter septicus]|uniref:hypothetical protein n=1 Tax=Mergibacter septicus TaxID=221402 RepID=UPI001179603E|nr:hypothetical protein [Mergibacter septicus]AWX14474.1 hypothetical protein CEP49_08000 [Mergibacter septicus]